MRSIDLTMVIAAYNEDAIMHATIVQVVQVLEMRPDLAWELILVNDGSQDGTAALLDEAARADQRIRVAHHPSNYGQGRALRTGFALARGATVLTWDADLSYHPDYIWQLYDTLFARKADIVLASPYAPGGVVRNVPGYRLFLSRWGNHFLARMCPYPVHTITCVVRAYRREILDDLLLSANGMEIQLETILKASIHQLRVVELPAVLEWRIEKLQAAGISRVSKMRILQSIQIYLQMGWLFRPSIIFMLMGLLFLLTGFYMCGWFGFRVLAKAVDVWPDVHSISQAVTLGLQEGFLEYPQTLLTGGMFAFIGLIIFLFSLVIKQSHYYFSEIVRQNRILNRRLTDMEGSVVQMRSGKESMKGSDEALKGGAPLLP